MCSVGGTLGFPCVHQYAHNNTKYMRRLPYALKGTDAVIYTVFQRGLALRVSFRPILNSIDDESLSNYEFDDEYDEDGNKISYPEGFVRVGDRLHGIKMDNSGDYEDHDSNGFSVGITFQSRKQTLTNNSTSTTHGLMRNGAIFNGSPATEPSQMK